MDQRLMLFAERVQSQYFSHFPIEADGQGGYAGLFLKHRIESEIEPFGEQIWLAHTRYRAPGGRAVREEDVIALCRASETAVILDRFARSIHLLNLLDRTDSQQQVFLPVSMALVEGVATGHGTVFRDILTRLALPCRIGILLPEALKQQPDRLTAIVANYRQNGFVCALQAGGSLTLLDERQAA